MSEQPQIYEFGRFRLDRAERTLRRGGEPVPLTPKVFGILLALVENSVLPPGPTTTIPTCEYLDRLNWIVTGLFLRAFWVRSCRVGGVVTYVVNS